LNPRRKLDHIVSRRKCHRTGLAVGRLTTARLPPTTLKLSAGRSAIGTADVRQDTTAHADDRAFVKGAEG
jgi:hypothetical protein